MARRARAKTASRLLRSEISCRIADVDARCAVTPRRRPAPSRLGFFDHETDRISSAGNPLDARALLAQPSETGRASKRQLPPSSREDMTRFIYTSRCLFIAAIRRRA